MKRKFTFTAILLICVIFCAFGFAACASKNDSKSGDNSSEPSPIEHVHSPIYVAARSATCTIKGNIAYYTCSCGKKFSYDNMSVELTDADITINKLGHDWETEWTIDIAATTERAGSKSHHCTRCTEKTDVTEIPMIGSQDPSIPIGHTHSPAFVLARSATCTTNGNTAYYYCSCGRKFSDAAATTEISDADITINKLGHDWETEWTVDITATLEHAGSKSHHCTRCSEKTGVTEIPRLTVTTYNVIFNANGGKIDGNDTKTITGSVNHTISRPNDPVRTDYTFTGWYRDGGTTTPWNFGTDTVTGATTLYAGWELNIPEYSVTFVHNYSGSTDTVKSTERGLITYIPTRSGYIFNGWYYSDGQTADGSYILSEKFDTSERVTRSGIRLYAEWVLQRTDDSQLYSPSVGVADGVFSWAAVDSAQGYKVEVYSGISKVSEESMTATSWTFPDGMTAGYYTVKIRANGDGEHTVNSAWTEKYYSHHMLARASVSFNISTSTISWETVKNAATYEVRVNGVLKATITYTTYSLADLEAGDYTVSVTPVRDNWSSSAALGYSITKKRLKTPEVTITENNDCSYTLSWTTVAHANAYRIKHHNTYINVTGTTYKITNDSPIYDADGTGEITVCAYDTNADYLISDDSETATVSKLYTLTLARNDVGAGSVYSAKTVYKVGDSVTVTANTHIGYTWVGWYNGTQELTKNLSYTFTMPSANATYTAKWCKVTISSNNTTAGTISSLNDTYKVGDSVTVTANTHIGYTWVGWYNGTQELTKNLSYTFTMPSANATYTAKWCKVTISSNNTTAGTISSLNDTYKVGDSVTVTANTHIGYTWVGWYNGTQELTKNLSYTFTMPSANATYTAKWKINEDLSNYNFTSTTTTLTITGVKDKSVNVLTIPDSATGIGNSAFSDCSSLTSITIPNNVTDIGDTAFLNCESLTSISVDTNNPKYSSHDGILYNKTKTQLIYVPSSITGAVTVPYGVTNIGSYAFYGCRNLTSIEIPSSVMSIGDYAFLGCRGLESITYTGDIKDWCELNGVDNIMYTTSEDYGFTYKSLTIGGKEITKKLTIPSDVTNIGSYAFYGCRNLTSIEIPSSVTSIGSSAFAKCVYLTSITVDTNNPNYSSQDGILYNKTKTRLIHVPSSITGAVTVPYGVTNIGSNTFSMCGYLTSITVDTNNPNYSSQDGILYNKAKTQLIHVPQAITGAVTIPYGITSIESEQFRYCRSLTSITIPNSVTYIGGYAFQNCSSLTSIEIPNSVTYIGGYAFDSCYIETAKIPISAISAIKSLSLKTVILTDGTRIENYAFQNCSSLTSIEIPNSVTSIGGCAFSGCRSLTSIEISNSVTDIGDLAFQNCDSLTSITVDTNNPNYSSQDGILYNKAKTQFIHVPKSISGAVTIPYGMTSIEQSAFSGCSKLTSIEIPNSVTDIGGYAFQNCDSLTSITVDTNNPNYSSQDGILYNKTKTQFIHVPKSISGAVTIPYGIMGIPSKQFSDCRSLTSITIPDSVTNIWSDAFSGCRSLTSIEISNSVTSIGEYAFYDCYSLTNINFNGTKAQWSTIKTGAYWDTRTGNYTVHCTDGDIAKS
ncbi:MAG: leucine-rich repeat protein [Roseburia sp.]|nr:leucine-rich repeat protein [Roseburia sp.]